MFKEPHFVVFYPFVFVGGGNLLEHDVVIYSPGRIAAAEFVSSAGEPLEKQLRHRLVWRRFVEVHFCESYDKSKKGSIKPKGDGVGIAERTCDEVCDLARVAWEVLQPYKRLVRSFYGVFPDLGHLNYLFATSSPDYLQELWEDLKGLGEALKKDGDEFYRLLGTFLAEKAKASRGEDADSKALERLAAAPPAPCEESINSDEAVVFMPKRRRGEPLAHFITYLAEALEATRSARKVYVVDGDFVKEDGRLQAVRRGELDSLKAVRLVVVRDYDKEAFDKYIDKALEEYGEVHVVYVPEYAVYGRGDTAPTADFINLDSERLEEAKSHLKLDACDAEPKLPGQRRGGGGGQAQQSQRQVGPEKLSPAPFYVAICTR